MNSFQNLNNQIALIAGEKYREQKDLFPHANHGSLLHNAAGLASHELMESETMNADIKVRNDLQQYVGSLPTFVKDESIQVNPMNSIQVK